MRILFIAPYVPSRIRVRPFQLIRELSRRHDVHVVALGEVGRAKVQGADELPAMAKDLVVTPHSKLRGYAQSLLSLPTRSPMCTAFCWSDAMQRAVADVAQGARFDVVHIEHLRAAHFARSCRHLPIVFDSVDCLTGLFSQMAANKRNPVAKLVMREETFKLRRYEPRAMAQFDRVVVTSETERQELVALDGALGVEIVPNGVDTDYFAPRDVQKAPHRVVFSGKMSYAPNAQAALWFAGNVFAYLRHKYADAEFVVAGSDPPPEVAKLAERPGITVTGYVEDMRPYLASSSVAVVPMRVAVGIQNKVLEAMAMALPVVATPIATRALHSDCRGLIQTSGAEQMVEEIAWLWDTPELAARIGQEGRDEVLRNFSWQSSVDKLELIYDEAIREHGGNS